MSVSPAFSAAIFSESQSTQMTLWPNSERHVAATKPTYPEPITEICILFLLFLQANKSRIPQLLGISIVSSIYCEQLDRQIGFLERGIRGNARLGITYSFFFDPTRQHHQTFSSFSVSGGPLFHGSFRDGKRSGFSPGGPRPIDCTAAACHGDEFRGGF